MALPLIPFVAGAVVGGLAAYLYRDERLRKRVRHTASDVGYRLKDTAETVGDKLSGVYDDIRDRVKQKTDDTVSPDEPVAKKAATKRVTKKTTAKKRTTKKKAAAKAPGDSRDADSESG